MSLWTVNHSYCPAYFDRISCWPPTEAGVRRIIPCPAYIFPDASSNTYASLLCTNESRWEERSHYELCIGCSSVDSLDLNTTDIFLIPLNFLIIRKYFIICANGLSIILLTIGIFILLGNRRLRQYSRNILHVNIFLVFLIRSIIKLIAEIFMNKGYFSHNVFERIDACNQTTIYFKEDQLLDCKLFTILINYINSSVSHWFVFCEALYLYRLLRAKVYKDKIRWYILMGWLVPLFLTIITYTTRYMLKKDLYTCWFEPSIYDWILHGPNMILQILNFLIFNYVCILLVRKLNRTYRTVTSPEKRRLAKYSRLARSTLILLPLFGFHYILFMWNIKPFLIPNLILIHLTVHTISSSLQGLIVASIYTILNSEVQREILRSLDRCLMRHYSSWEQPNYFHNYINKLEDKRLNYLGNQKRVSMPVQYRQTESDILVQHNRLTRKNKSRSI
ncbi:unnamed protein product [Rotaria sordida]|uniref:Uncharacterized protein n=1 Tax=Rotaria sordida TaxID=392033 RepID=A0A818WS75_9BILA|nr:unnamed protein product [Rotaria sordida]